MKQKMRSKKRSTKSIVMVIMAVAIALSACSGGGGKAQAGDYETDTIRVVTTIAQIGEPIAIIGGERVTVDSLMGPGVDPHLYNASQGDIQTLQQADVVFYSGLNLEGNMTEVFAEIGKSKSVLAIAETIAEEKLLLDEEGAVDPHIWFDIDLWREALDSAVEELKRLSPNDSAYFESNKQAYDALLEELKHEASKIAEIPDDKRVLVTAHDAFGYFGRMHEMEVVGLQGLSTQDEISLTDIQDTIDLLIERRVPAVFIESTIPKDKIQSVIDGAAAKGVKVKLGGELFSDAMGEQGTEEGTYIGMYRHNVNTIYEALTESE